MEAWPWKWGTDLEWDTALEGQHDLGTWNQDGRLSKKQWGVKRLVQEHKARREVEAHLSNRLEGGRGMMESRQMALRAPRQRALRAPGQPALRALDSRHWGLLDSRHWGLLDGPHWRLLAQGRRTGRSTSQGRSWEEQRSQRTPCAQGKSLFEGDWRLLLQPLH